MQEGVCVAKKDFHLKSHPELVGVPNLHVIKACQSLASKGLVKEQFAWRHYYWYLNNEGIEFLREFLNLPAEIVPATLRRQTRATDVRTAGAPRCSYSSRILLLSPLTWWHCSDGATRGGRGPGGLPEGGRRRRGQGWGGRPRIRRPARLPWRLRPGQALLGTDGLHQHELIPVDSPARLLLSTKLLAGNKVVAGVLHPLHLFFYEAPQEYRREGGKEEDRRNEEGN